MALALSAQANPSNPVRVASKNFAENYLLAEIVAQLLEGEGIAVERAFGLGGTLICYQALLNAEIDLYVEYTGTLSQAILQRPELTGREELNSALTERGIRLLPQLGFNNTYAIAVRSQLAESLGLRNIGDLAEHPQLRLVFSHEFLERGDGWPGLAKRYALPHSVEGIEHALAYQAIADGANLTKDLGNLPPNYCTPTYLGSVAKKIAKDNQMKVKVLGKTEITKLKMGSFLSVAKGSREEPRFIVLEHMRGSRSQKPIVLVGKGITFDAGGISLKPGLNMDEMKWDMGGAATVLGVMHTVGQLKLPLNIYF